MAFSKPKAHERAERYAAKGQHDRAAREYQAIVEHDPKDVRAWLMLADCLVRTGDKVGALERYTRVAQYYVEAKELNKALAVYGQMLALDNTRIDIQTKVATLNLQLGKTQDGIAVYERVAQAHMQQGRIGDALNIFKLVADADPTAVARRLRLAELYSREKRNAEAVEAFREAGQQLREGDRLADFVRVAERLLYHDEGDLPTIRELARAYLDLRDPRRALMKLNGLLRANPKDEEGIELLAETFMALGKPEKALSALEELARTLKAKGPSAKADTIRILRRGLEWRPAHAEFRESLAELEGRRRSGANAIQQPQQSAPEPEPDVVVDDEIETLDEDDLVELDEDDVVIEDDEPVDEIKFPEDPPPKVALPEAGSSAPGNRQTTEIEAIPSVESSLTQSVLSEVESDSSPDLENLTDFDKILFEARVYIKYRLFDHALDHVQQALNQQPDHLGALSLQARALTELGRGAEAAVVHVRVAEMVMLRDPKLAREHINAAKSLTPSDPHVQELGDTLGQTAPKPEPEPEPEPEPASLPTAKRAGASPPASAQTSEPDGDSGAFDLIDDDFDLPGPGPADAEPPANLIAAHDEPAYDEPVLDEPVLDEPVLDGPSTQPFTPIELENAQAATSQDTGPKLRRTPFPIDEDDGPEPAQTGRTLLPFPDATDTADAAAMGVQPDSPRTGRTQMQMPAIGGPSDGVGGLDLNLDAQPPGDLELDLAPMGGGSEVDLDAPTEPTPAFGTDDDAPDLGAAFDSLGAQPESEPPPEDSEPIEIDAEIEEFDPGDVEFVSDPEPEPEPEPEPVALEPEPEPVALEPEPEPEPVAFEPEPEPEPVALEPEPEPAPEPAAAAPAAPPGGWPDISDEIAEIRFYLDQGLDEDADAALDDLEGRYPGHPEIAKIRGNAVEEEPAVIVEAEAAAPLVDLGDGEPVAEPLVSFDEDEDEDAYLSAIFADPTESKPKEQSSASTAGANVAEGQAVDAATAFDLGVAYREMGLVDAAIGQFETAASDPQWRARALVMLGTLRVHRGETDQAIANLNEAAGLAATPAEASEAAYELGVLYEMLGDVGSAIAQFLQVDPGYRDRDERLANLDQ